MPSPEAEALERESSALVEVLAALDEGDCLRPTNCPPWDLRELVVHVADSLTLPETFPPAPPDAAPRSAADYYRRDERRTTAYRQANVEAAQRAARDVPDGAAAIDHLRAAAATAVRRFAGEYLDRAVDVPWLGALRLGDYAATRVVSVAAHGLDVAITLGAKPWTTAAALAVTRPILVDLLGAPLPESLGWDDGRLLEAGTGRRPLTAADRAHLGHLAARFPLLS